MALNRRRASLLALLAVGALLLAGQLAQRPGDGNGPPGDTPAPVFQAFSGKQSGVWLGVSGTVTRLLPDDNDGSRHQRFVITLDDGHTVLISHNIDLAERLPLRAGDAVSVRGRYEYNARGGVVHWTHHDPGGAVEGGWIDHEGRRYR